jgi:hypothetical protein
MNTLALTKWKPTFPLVAGLLTFVFHLAANPHYGFFRDELYFIICGFHPQWGYVDQPPVVPLLAAASQLFGHSLFLLRAIPAAFAGASVYTVCLLVLEFGGGRFALTLAALSGTLSPVLAAFGEKVGPDMVGLWLWPLAVLFLVRIVKGGDPRQWIGVGLAIGISAESKYSVLYFVVAFLIGLLISPQRRILFSKWFAAGAAVAIVIALPSALWQAANGFPMLEVLKAGQNGKNVILSPIQFLFAEFLIVGPILSFVWIGGLIWTLLKPSLRFIGYGFILLIAAMILSHAKHYYPGDVYPILFAAGGVAIEAWTAGARFLRPVAAAVAVAGSLVFLPYVEPILPEDTFIAYNKAVGPKLGLSATVTEHEKQNWMTQDFADMHGWPELAATVQRVYDTLSPSDRAQAVAVGGNYGEASAVAFFSTVPAISGHNQFYLWGPRGNGNVLIDIGGDCGKSLHLFRSAKRAAVFLAPYVMPYEDDMPIMVCRGITRPIGTIWSKVKNYE